MKTNRERFLLFVQTGIIVHYSQKPLKGAQHLFAVTKMDDALRASVRMPEKFDPVRGAISFLLLHVGSQREAKEVSSTVELHWLFEP